MNILIMSPGRRVEIVEYFMQEVGRVGGKVYTLDMNPITPALFFSDDHFCIEKEFDDLRPYMMKTVEICDRYKINLVLTLIDPELLLLAEYRKEFEKVGTEVMVSKEKLIKATFDKYEFCNYFGNIVPTIRTVADKETLIRDIKKGDMTFPIFAKPCRGSGSAGLTTISDMDRLQKFQPEEDYVYQPYSKVKEYGIDMYFNMKTGKLERYFIKEKISMRSGETDKSRSVHNEAIANIIKKLDGIGFCGTIDMDIFLGPDDKYYVNEINPRFGGGYPHAHYCGMNYVKSLVNELAGKDREQNMDDYEDGIIMMKYNNYYFSFEDGIRGAN